MPGHIAIKGVIRPTLPTHRRRYKQSESSTLVAHASMINMQSLMYGGANGEYNNPRHR
jgi:hypothetical protein